MKRLTAKQERKIIRESLTYFKYSYEVKKVGAHDYDIKFIHEINFFKPYTIKIRKTTDFYYLAGISIDGETHITGSVFDAINKTISALNKEAQ